MLIGNIRYKFSLLTHHRRNKITQQESLLETHQLEVESMRDGE
jgi:hypothetical protein